jgi:hypothetical protein
MSKGGDVFALVVRFYLRDEEAAKGFDNLVAETVAKIRESEPGTLIYAVHRTLFRSLRSVGWFLPASDVKRCLIAETEA